MIRQRRMLARLPKIYSGILRWIKPACQSIPTGSNPIIAALMSFTTLISPQLIISSALKIKFLLPWFNSPQKKLPLRAVFLTHQSKIATFQQFPGLCTLAYFHLHNYPQGGSKLAVSCHNGLYVDIIFLHQTSDVRQATNYIRNQQCYPITALGTKTEYFVKDSKYITLGNYTHQRTMVINNGKEIYFMAKHEVRGLFYGLLGVYYYHLVAGQY